MTPDLTTLGKAVANGLDPLTLIGYFAVVTAANGAAFVINVGDTIQGGGDDKIEEQWKEIRTLFNRYKHYPLYLVPGNHDVFSAASEKAFARETGRPLSYSFNYQNAHFTVLDNSRGLELSAAQLEFLEADLARHQLLVVPRMDGAGLRARGAHVHARRAGVRSHHDRLGSGDEDWVAGNKLHVVDVPIRTDHDIEPHHARDPCGPRQWRILGGRGFDEPGLLHVAADANALHAGRRGGEAGS